MEPIDERSRMEELADAIKSGHRIRRTLDLDEGGVALDDADAFDRHGDALVLTDHTMATLHGPSWRLLIIGAGQMTVYLAQMAHQPSDRNNAQRANRLAGGRRQASAIRGHP